MAVIAILIFLCTLTLVIWQPKQLNIAWSATGGAILCLLFSVVTWQDVIEVTSIVWNATLTFIGIIIISLILDEIGFFEWAALHMVKLAKGNGTVMFIYMVLLGAVVSALFANDGAALIMTPIVLAMVRALKFSPLMVIPFVMASGFIADTASAPFITSNLTNIVAADFFNIGFAEYASRMLVPNYIAIIASLAVLYMYYRKHIPHTFDGNKLAEPLSAIKDMKLFKLSWLFIAILLLAYFGSEFVQVPVSFIALSAAMIMLVVSRKSKVIETKKMLKQAPWNIVIFSISMYVVVYGLKNAGLTYYLTVALNYLAEQGLLISTIGMGLIAAFLSSTMNNLPTLMIDALAIDATSTSGVLREGLIYANVIGSDLGTKITPIGSLATLIWLHILAGKDVKISWGYYFRVGIVITLPTLVITLAALAGWLYIIQVNMMNIWISVAIISVLFVVSLYLYIKYLTRSPIEKYKQQTQASHIN